MDQCVQQRRLHLRNNGFMQATGREKYASISEGFFYDESGYLLRVCSNDAKTANLDSVGLNRNNSVNKAEQISRWRSAPRSSWGQVFHGRKSGVSASNLQ